MNEISKTLTFVAVAALVVLAAIFTRPVIRKTTAEDYRGQLLYPNFADPTAVSSLEIVEFDENTASVSKFLVNEADVGGKTRWIIPSHYNYPADAKDQVADAAGSLLGLTITKMIGDKKSDQKEYGVLAPDPVELSVGDIGVGEQVVMRDATGKILMSLIIGNEVPEKPEYRYVRKTDEDQIYVVKLNTSKLSTNFADWIERNPLEIQTWDMQSLWFRNYYVDEMNSALIQLGNIRVGYQDTGDPQWKLTEDLKLEQDPDDPKKGIFVPVKLAADEELNIAILNELKSELDTLKIADVSPKPKGISADLKMEAGFNDDPKTIAQLKSKGFFLTPLVKNGPVELFSNEGELRISMKDGVEYVLRFGEIAYDSKKEKLKEGETDSGVNRYLFVMAEFNPEIIPKPQFEPLPEMKKDKPVEEKPVVEKEPGDKQAESEEKPVESADKTDEQIQAERDRIKTSNQRKQDEYDRLVAEGKRHAAELNARFADWYYVISNDVFKKLHLGRDELIKKKAPPTADGPGTPVHSDAHDKAAFPAEVLDKLKANHSAVEKKAEEKTPEEKSVEEKPVDGK